MQFELTYSLQWREPHLITGTSGGIVQWAPIEPPATYDCHHGAETDALWSPSGEQFAVTGWDSSLIQICDSNFRRISSFEGYSTMAWNPVANELAQWV